MKREFEMSDGMQRNEFVNPLSNEKRFSVDDDDIKNDYLQQNPFPWRKKVHTFDPEFFKCDNKIVKFNYAQLGDFRALVSFSHTILSEGNTWKHLTLLTGLCFITMAIVYYSQSYRSVNDSSNVSSRIQTLISFVFASYVSLVINRWDRIRNTTLGQQWGSLENLVFTAIKLIRQNTKKKVAQLTGRSQQFQSVNAEGKECTDNTGDSTSSHPLDFSKKSFQHQLSAIEDEEAMLVNRIIRYARLSLILTFRGAQGSDDFVLLDELQLLSADEERWLRAAAIGTRPLMVVSWISEYFDDLLPSVGITINEVTGSFIATNVMSLRGGIGGTLGAVGSQLPYAYVHVITWTIQILLCALAVETGVVLSVYLYMDENGAGNYSPANDDTWPERPYVWYLNNFMQITAGNVIYALFVEGMLNICEKLSNPLGDNEMCFSDRLFDTFLLNNCRALYAGCRGFKKVDAGDIDNVKKPVELKKTV